MHAALRAGASGFVLKTASAVALAEAVRAVAAGDAALAPSVSGRLIADLTRRTLPAPADHHRLRRLTDRKTEVLALVARGLSNAEIAAELTVAEQTGKTHVSRVLAKFELRDRTQAAIFAHENGLPGGRARDPLVTLTYGTAAAPPHRHRPPGR